MEELKNIQWSTIKGWIVDNTKDVFRPNHASINDVVELFFKLLTIPVEDQSLNGIPDIYPIALQRIIVDEKDIPSQFINIGRIESFLRKILLIVDRNEYYRQKDAKEGLSVVIEALRLNKNFINFNWDSLHDSQKTNNAEQLLLAYKLRNIESHYCESKTKLQLQNLLKDIIIVYLFAIDEHYGVIHNWLKSRDPRKKAYLEKVENQFKEWNGRFVPIIGQEQFKEVTLYAVEARTDSETPREGDVEQLRKELISTGQNQMIIVGEAGLGKTTSMKYIALRDARQGRMPVYIELKLLTKDDSLRNTILENLRKISDDITSLTNDTQDFYSYINSPPRLSWRIRINTCFLSSKNGCR